MSLFDSTRLQDDGPAVYAEPLYHYLNRSTRPELERMRTVLDDWFSHYPADHARELRRCLCGKDDTNHRAAFFELFLHELLLRLGCEVVVHPDLPNGKGTHPDFLVKPPASSNFYLEAAVVDGETPQQKSANTRMNTVYDTLNRMHSPNFFLHMQVRGAPSTLINGSSLRKQLQDYLSTLDPDKIRNVREDYDYEAAECFRYCEAGWEIDFFPVPKSASLRGKSGVRPLGRRTTPVHRIRPAQAIKSTILRKTKHYGELCLPLVVAVNVVDLNAGHYDYQEALIGTEYITVDNVGKPVIGRESDGGFYHSSHLSAVLLIKRLRPDSITRAWNLLVHNGRARHPYDSVLTRLPQAGRGPGIESGESLASIFQLPPDWPE